MGRVDDRERIERRLQSLQREHARGWKAVVVRRLLLVLVAGAVLLGLVVAYFRLSHGTLTPADVERIDIDVIGVFVIAALSATVSWSTLQGQMQHFQSRLAEIDRRETKLRSMQ